jgi:AraC-like DNA-binding protein
MNLPLFFHILILLGGIQGLITGSLLIVEGKNWKANYFLGGLIGLMALASINLFLEYTGWYYSSTPIAIIHNLIPLVILMPAGPLLLFYVHAAADPAFRFTKKHKLQFLPVIIDFLPALTSAIFIIGVKTNLVFPDARPWGLLVDYLHIYSDIPRWIAITMYALLSLRLLERIKKGRAKNNESLITWLRQFIRIFLIFQLAWLLYLIPYVIPATTDFMLRTFNWYPVYIPLTFLIYWLGIKGLIVTYRNKTRNKISSHSTSLQPVIIEETVTNLKKAMETDKIFLNPNLTLDILSQHTRIPPKTISIVLNQHLQKSFNEFVNGYRVEEVKKRLQENPQSNLTILGTALESGFNSKASFQRIFKEMTGISPGGYQKNFAKPNRSQIRN